MSDMIKPGSDLTKIDRPPSTDAGSGSLKNLLTRAARQAHRCGICRWILENQGTRTDLLNGLMIGGVCISAEAQTRHLLINHDEDRE